MLKGAIFDMDGLIVDTEPLIMSAWSQALGTKVDKSEWERFIGLSEEEVAKHFVRFTDDKDVAGLLKRKTLAAMKLIEEGDVRVMDGVAELLKRLKSTGVKTAIATGSKKPKAELILKNTGLLPLFDVVVCSEDVGKKKPNPDVYNLVLERMGLGPGDCVALEDSAPGVQAAKAAGIFCIAVPNEHTKNQDFSSADMVRKSLKEITMEELDAKNFPSHIFRAYDIRGEFGKDLTPDIMYKIGMALGTLMKRKKLGQSALIGNDIRESSELLSRMLVSGLRSTGIDVTDVGTTSFGVALFSGWRLKRNVTAYITASHLGPEWNGVKFYVGEGIGFSEEDNYALGELAKNDDFDITPEHVGRLERANLKEEYVGFMKQNFRTERRLKIAVDCGNGSMCLSAPEVFEALGFEVVKIFCDVDPSFPNRPSDPAPANIGALVKAVRDTGADFGVAFDGDGDRAAIVDDTGRALTGNEIGIIIGRDLLSKRKGKIITTVACSLMVDKQLKPLGGDVVQVQVGHTFVLAECAKQKGVMGMEESNHIVIPDYFAFDDSLIVPLKIAEIMDKSGKKLSGLVDFPILPFEEIVFKCPDGRKFKVVERVKKKILAEYPNTNPIDGIRVDFDDSWILIRAANTSPKIRLYVEAEMRERFEELKDKFTKIMQEAGL